MLSLTFSVFVQLLICSGIASSLFPSDWFFTEVLWRDLNFKRSLLLWIKNTFIILDWFWAVSCPCEIIKRSLISTVPVLTYFPFHQCLLNVFCTSTCKVQITLKKISFEHQANSWTIAMLILFCQNKTENSLLSYSWRLSMSWHNPVVVRSAFNQSSIFNLFTSCYSPESLLLTYQVARKRS